MANEQKRKQLTALFGVYGKRLERLYDKYINQLSALAVKTGVSASEMLSQSPLYHFDDFPEIKEEFNRIFSDYFQKNILNYRAGITDGVALAYSHDNALLNGFSVLSNKALSQARKTAAETFIRSRLNAPQGLNLSQLVWNYCSQTKSEFEMAISNVLADGLKKGTSAADLARQVRQYLNNPDMMYRRYHQTVVDAQGNKKDIVKWRRRVIDENGKVRFVEQPLEKVGMGHYRSSRKNSERLMRTEINMAYHKTNSSRWENEPFVIGIVVELSPQHPAEDMCDDLAGRYPKDFAFIGWHPQCYSDDTKVLTAEGWKLFADVTNNDKILSLNPNTRQTEYVSIIDRQCWEKQGNMIHFYNRNLDCLVTPEHRMVYLNKSDGRIKYCTATEYRKSLGGFYRGCEYAGEEKEYITIGKTELKFDDFCEFMGYYLSDGSLIRTHQVVISQRDGQPHKQTIIDCIGRMGFRTTVSYDYINFYSGDLCSYLRQFGVCNQKYIPNEIMNASARQIEVFLSAFIKCDGYIKKPHAFIGSKGGLCVPKNGERMFYTTSRQMAGNLCELLLKIGHRPSIREVEPSDSVKKDGSVIHGNLLCYKISDCNSQTATVFNKEVVQYNGNVYDLTLERNHIMYVSRNGRCFWGSNCLCMSYPITLQGEEKKEFYRRLAAGEDMSNYVSPNAVTDIPDKAKAWIKENHDKFVSAAERGKLGYIWRDNQKYLRPFFSQEEQQRMGIAPQKTKHIKTEEEKADIQRRWDERKAKNALILKTGRNVLNVAENLDYIELNGAKNILHDAIISKDIDSVKNFTKFVAKEIAYINKEAKTIETTIPEAKEWLKQFSVQDIKGVENIVKENVAKWTDKYFADSYIKSKYATIDDYLIAKLKSEALYVVDETYLKPHTFYPTSKVAESAYYNLLAKFEHKIEMQALSADIAEIKNWSLAHPKSKKVANLLNESEALFQEDKDIAQIKAKVNDAKAEIKKREYEQLRRDIKKGKSIISDKRLADVSEQEAWKLIKAFEAEHGDVADLLHRPQTEALWKTLTDMEKHVLTKYTQTYSYLNEPLREIQYYGDRKLLEFQKDMPILTQVLNKMEATQNMVVRRGTSNFRIKTLGKHLSELNAGDEFVDGAFLSTSVSTNHGFFESYNLVIVIPRGAKGIYAEPFSHYTDSCNFSFKTGKLWDGLSIEAKGNEWEWIGQRGSKFKVLKKEGDTLYLQMIGQMFEQTANPEAFF